MVTKKIIDLINREQRFLVTAHANPDGDAIGATLGLTLALQEMDKQVTAFNADGVPEVMAFLPGSKELSQELPEDAFFDAVFVLDAGEPERTGLDVRRMCRTLINIDHHPHSDFGDLRFVDTRASATAVLIYRLLRETGHPISRPVAKALYLGILADTGSFRYSSANPEAFAVAGELIATGIDPWEAASCLYESYAPQRMRLLGRVLPTLDISPCGRYASVTMLLDDLLDSAALPEHADGFVNYPRAIRGVEVALFFNQVEEDVFKISFRSRGTIDVGRIARDLGGGGHHNAAGARLQGPLDEIKKYVAAILDRSLS